MRTLAFVLLLVAAPLSAQRAVDVRVLPAVGPVPASGDTLRFERFQDALRNGVFDARPGLPPDVAGLVEGLRALLAGDRSDALARFEALGGAQEEGVRGVATQARLELLFEAGRWTELADAIVAAGGDVPPVVQGMLATGTPSFEGIAPVSARLEIAGRGQALLHGTANGTPAAFYYDTGAAITTITDSLAARLGVTFPWTGSVSVSTATTLDREARIGQLRDLRLGNVHVRGLPVFVFPAEDLRFELPTGGVVHIDAILGWDVIRRTRGILDLGAGTYTLTLSDGSLRTGEPLVWSGYPILRIHAETGEPLLFGVDTGSFNTSITENLLTKLDVGAVVADTVPIGGVGGFVDTPVRVAERVRLRLSDQVLQLGGAWTETSGGADEVFFFALDGVLGIDVAQGCVLEVDAPARRLDLRCPPP